MPSKAKSESAKDRPVIRYEVSASCFGKRYRAKRFGATIGSVAGAVSPRSWVWIILHRPNDKARGRAAFIGRRLRRARYVHVRVVEIMESPVPRDLAVGSKKARTKDSKPGAPTLFDAPAEGVA